VYTKSGLYFPPFVPFEVAFETCFPSSATSSPISIQSTPPPLLLPPMLSNRLLNLPTLPPTNSSSPLCPPILPLFHNGLLVRSRVRRNRDRGDVVQCTKEDPSERITRCGNWGTTGLVSLFGRRFRMWERPYGDVECLRTWG